MDPISTAQTIVRDYHKQLVHEASEAHLKIAHNDYMLVPTRMFDHVADIVGDEVSHMLFYRMGFEIAQIEARRLFAAIDVADDLLLRIAIGPLHFMSSGLGIVNLLHLELGEVGKDNTLLLTEHPQSNSEGLEVGYAAGWLSTVTQSSMVARHISVDEPGERLIIAHQDHILEHLENPQWQQPRSSFNVQEVRPLNL